MININVEQNNSTTIIHLSGDFRIDNIGDVENTWDESIKKHPTTIAFNFKSIYYIDSSAIGMLVKLLNKAKNEKINLVFFDMSQSIYQVFQSARLNNFFTIMTREQFVTNYITKK
jgi:anti-sigma B factor antagonist